MNIELLKKWVTALRGNKYKRTKFSLYADGAYCAMGVLAAVSVGKKEVPQEITTNGKGKSIDVKYMCLIGLGAIKQLEIIKMNDGGKNIPFKRIANYIEKTYIDPWENK